jgi:uroporphyrinogen-III synthase
LLLTRPDHSARAFAQTLDPAALTCVNLLIAPLMEITATGDSVSVRSEDAVIFTSQNGVRFAPDGQGRRAFCVGAKTAQTARARGWRGQHSGDTAQELIARLAKLRPAEALWHLGGAHTIGDIAQSLSSLGMTVRHVTLYQQDLLPLDTVARDALTGRCIVPVFSPRSAAQLVHEAKGQLGKADIIALSDSVAAPFSGESVSSCTILPAPQVIYMRKAVENLCLTLCPP